jgi:hypothetical protein
VVIQAVVQGALMPLAYFAVHRAVLTLGSKRVAILMAFVPVMTLVTGHWIVADPVAVVEMVAVGLVSMGVAIGAVLRAA